MHFNITKKNDITNKSFRVAQLYDQFDLAEDSFEEHFEGDIDLEKEWQVGAIVGKSGTGKSTIARELFADYFFMPEYKERSVIDDFPKMDSTELFSILSSVGFSSPPSWLKPYSVLSSGEKMRVDLARAICEKKDIIVFDEYTSVVDREVAQIGSYALQRAIKKPQKSLSRLPVISTYWNGLSLTGFLTPTKWRSTTQGGVFNDLKLKSKYTKPEDSGKCLGVITI